MGLFLELDPEQVMTEGNLDDPDLEAELAALTGNAAGAGGRVKPKGKSPLPMEDIAKMADECLRDIDEDEEDGNVEEDQDLLAELQEVVGMGEADAAAVPQDMKTSSAAPGSLQHTLEERISLYKIAIQNSKTAGEASKARRYERGLKTLQTMLTAAKKGRPVNEAEIPPPVATGAHSADSGSAVPQRPAPPVPSRPPPDSSPPGPDASREEEQSSSSEYKMAALKAKKQGDLEQARLYLRTSKVCTTPPAASSPNDVLEALEQRRAKYIEAINQAKANGDDRKARMHERISKQYQSAIRAHKAGKVVNFEELPIPPGFPPIPGHKSTGAEQAFVAALVAVDKLTAADTAEEPNDEEEVCTTPTQPTLDVSRASQSRKPPPSPHQTPGELSPTAVQQLEFLEGRKKQYLKAALQAKQKNDIEQAKALFRTAKTLDPIIEGVRSGGAVDISSVSDEDFILVHHSDVQVSDKAQQVYAQLMKILGEQYEKCRTHSEQFTHLGNVTETTKFEKMAESCKKSLEVLKLAQSRGLPPPKHHFEEISFHTVRIFPELSSTDMVVIIVKGMNLPAPTGVQPNDLDAYVKFDFPYPSTEQPQKHKTSVIKNTNCPEYNQSFTLSINRNHRGFRRVVSSRGLKLELLHKGGFLRSDKPIGTAVVKLDKLETQSEIREIIEVMNGRKPTGGRVEVKVRLREPLSGQDMQTSTERWLLISPAQVPLKGSFNRVSTGHIRLLIVFDTYSSTSRGTRRLPFPPPSTGRRQTTAGRLQLAPRPFACRANAEGAQCEADPAEFMSASLCPAGIYALTPKLITIAVDPAPPTQQGGHIYDLQSVNKVELVHYCETSFCFGYI
uniref:Coiled-coil and C2 domain-containing protein 1B n=1 Tax=Takifugu rubripes TaxID=31033 RepID=A0A674NLX8_TAKRU